MKTKYLQYLKNEGIFEQAYLVMKTKYLQYLKNEGIFEHVKTSTERNL